MRLTCVLILCVISLWNGIPAAASSQSGEEIYAHLANRDDAYLLSRGKELLQTDTLAAEAMACFSIVANRRYDKPTDRVATENAVEALRNMANLHMTRMYDYKGAYTDLATALQLALEAGVETQLPYIYISLANLWQMNTHLNESSRNHVRENLHLALESAISAGVEDAMPPIAINMTSVRMGKGSWGEYAADVELYKRYQFKTNPELNRYASAMIAGTEAMFAKQWDEAEKNFLVAGNSIDCNLYAERYRFSADAALARAYRAAGKPEKAVELLENDIKVASRGGFPDYEMHFYKTLSDLYKEVNEPDSAAAYYNRYLGAKQSITDNYTLGNVSETDFLSQIDKINEEVRNLSLKRIEQRRNLVLLIGILAVAVVVLIAVSLSYRSLRRNHRKLYEKNKELLRYNDELRQLRSSVLDNESANESVPVPQSVSAQEDAEEESAETSHVQDEYLESLYKKILNVLDTSPEIYSIGFGVTGVAKLVKAHHRYVSQAINKYSGSNFNQILISYRIREACRLMHSPEYSQYTVEAIAESVGFRSRTSFSTLFKKAVGLSPSEYFRMAKSGQDVDITL